jgi:hypothetical protein
MPSSPDQSSPGEVRVTGPNRMRALHRAALAAACVCVLLAALLCAPLGNADDPVDWAPGASGSTAVAVRSHRASPRPWLGATRAAHRPSAAAAPVINPVAGWPVASLRLTGARPRPVPASFLGLSTEYWTLPHYASDRKLFERVIDLLRVPGSPFTLRIGGDSADMSWWDPHNRRPPGWAYALTSRWLSQAVKLVTEAHLRVLLDLNLVDRNPARAVQLVRAVIAQMPPHSVQALEIGNEPDLYSVMGGLGTLATAPRAKVLRYFAWASRYSPATYNTQFNAYEDALARAGVRLPLGGPALSDPTDTEWLPSLIAAERGRLAFVSAHRYPFSACQTDRTAPDFPTIGRLLGASASAGLARSVKAAVLISHRAGLPFRLTEFNAVTCGGTAAVSGTFANALWAPDALFSVMRVGVDAVDVHVRARAYNAPFFVTRHGLRPRPIFYGLIMFQRMLGRHSWLLPATLRTPDGIRLTAWVVRTGRTVRTLLINKGRSGADVRLRLGATVPARVERLLAASPAARTGVTLAGQSLSPGGNWRGRFEAQTVWRGAGGYEVAVPAYSAALVSVRPAIR